MWHLDAYLRGAAPTRLFVFLPRSGLCPEGSWAASLSGGEGDKQACATWLQAGRLGFGCGRGATDRASLPGAGAGPAGGDSRCQNCPRKLPAARSRAHWPPSHFAGDPAGAERAEGPKSAPHPVPPGLTLSSQNRPLVSETKLRDNGFDVEVTADPCSLETVTSTFLCRLLTHP